MKLRHLAVGMVVGALALAGCGGGDDEPDDYERVEIETAAEWAINPVDVGELIGTTHTDSWQIDVFQVGTSTTLEDSSWVDRDSGDNLLPAGSEIVILNFVYTNISDTPNNVGLSMGNPTMKHEDYDYLGSMFGETKREHVEPYGLAFDLVRLDAIDDAHTFVIGLEPGESIAEPTTVKYIPGTDLTLKLSLTPVDDNGDLDHDNTEEPASDLKVTVN